MIILVTNYQDLIDFTPQIYADDFQIKTIYFNPWGFSRSGIKAQINEALKAVKLSEKYRIIFCIKNLFFGRRVEVALRELESLSPNNLILNVDRDDLELFLNNLSV